MYNIMSLFVLVGNLSQNDLNKKCNFYIAFKSQQLSEQITELFSGDQLNVELWNPIDKMAVGK